MDIECCDFDKNNIVKSISDGEKTIYLIRNENNGFEYCLSEMSDIEGGHLSKRHKGASSRGSSETPVSSVPSASHWREEHKSKFKICFSSKTIKSSHSEQLKQFFNKEEKALPKFLEKFGTFNIHDDVPADFGSVERDLVNQLNHFQTFGTEAVSLDVTKNIMKLFIGKDQFVQSQVKLMYGVADLVFTKRVESWLLMFCAVGVKGARSVYDEEYREKCRTQLAAYIISMAIENDKKLRMFENKRFGSQTLYGVLQIGLSPFFYRTEITDSYIDAIKSFEAVPDVQIQELLPNNPYNDRELLNNALRPTLLKFYQALLSEDT